MISRKDIYRPWKWKTILRQVLGLEQQIELLKEQLKLRVNMEARLERQVDQLTTENESLKMQQQKSKADMAGLLRWIYVTHHLTGPFLEGAVRNILAKDKE